MQDIKLLISYHKQSVLFKNEMLIPIHVGRHNNPSDSWLNSNMIGDNTGDNISYLNSRFNEMTAIYWAWKNYDTLENPSYIGFMHYRRHFIYNTSLKNFFYDMEYFKSNYVESLNYKNMRTFVVNFDCITTNPSNNPITIYEEYKFHHVISDLDCVMDIINKKYPHFSEVSKNYIYSNKAYYCNMFIMKKEIFFEYCAWIFDIMFEFERLVDVSNRSETEKRTYISERLTGIFFEYLNSKNLKLSSLPITYVLNTDNTDEIYPAYNDNNVSVLFTSTDFYAKFLCISIKSLIINSNPHNNYDILILDDNISEHQKKLIKNMECINISIRFISVILYLQNIDTRIFLLDNEYNSISTYFRFFIPTICKNFEKIIYLDSDIAVFNDIADLWNLSFTNEYIAAVRDMFMPLWRKKDIAMENYLMNELGLQKTDNYFQAGVLLFNIKTMIADNVQEKFFQKLQKMNRLILMDQDILNFVCQERTLFLPSEWNVDRNVIKFIQENPALVNKAWDKEMLNSFEFSKKNPKIVHFAGSEKPWNNLSIDFASDWWSVARTTPFYEYFLLDLFKTKNKKDENKIMDDIELIDLKNELETIKKCASFKVGRLITFFPRKIRIMVNIFLHDGTKHCTVVKKIYLKLRGWKK